MPDSPAAEGENSPQPTPTPPTSEESNRGELSSDNAASSPTNNNEQNQSEETTNGSMIDITSGMTADEATKLLQSIRDRQMARRAYLKQKARLRAFPVEKDW
jgi:Ca-activated chloride channel family protein